MNDQEKLIKKESNRYQVLKYIYDETNGNTYTFLDYDGIKQLFAENYEMTSDEVQSAILYLQDEGLINRSNMRTSITHQGIKEVEASIKNPDKATEHFSLKAIQLVIKEVIMGDKFEKISNSTIINRSSVKNSFNQQIKERYGEEIANSIIELDTEVEKSDNEPAKLVYKHFKEELEQQEPDKSKLRQYWDSLLKILSDSATLGNVALKIASLFT